MPTWLAFTLLATLLFGIYPIFGDKAGQIHGPKINFIIDNGVFLIYSIVLLIFYRQDIVLITKRSLVYGLLMGVVSGSAFFLMLCAWQEAPAKLPKIMVTIGFSVVITAIISNFSGIKLTISEWFWAIGATVCIAGLNWKS